MNGVNIDIILPLDERADKDIRTVNYADLTKHLRSQHWAAASKAYALNVAVFREVATDLEYTDRGKRLREKMASLN